MQWKKPNSKNLLWSDQTPKIIEKTRHYNIRQNIIQSGKAYVINSFMTEVLSYRNQSIDLIFYMIEISIIKS